MTEQDRFFLDKSDPSSWRAVNAFSRKVGAAAEDAGITAPLVQLSTARVSLLTGAALCRALPVRKAEAAGVTAQQLAVLPAWRDTVLFNAVERAALIIAETATLLPDENTRHAEQAAAREALNNEQYSALQWTAIAINAFNRISILSGHPVRSRKTASAPAGATTSSGGAR